MTDLGWDFFLYRDGKKVGSPNKFEIGYPSKEAAERSMKEWLRRFRDPSKLNMRAERILPRCQP